MPDDVTAAANALTPMPDWMANPPPPQQVAPPPASLADPLSQLLFGAGQAMLDASAPGGAGARSMAQVLGRGFGGVNTGLVNAAQGQQLQMQRQLEQQNLWRTAAGNQLVATQFPALQMRTQAERQALQEYMTDPQGFMKRHGMMMTPPGPSGDVTGDGSALPGSYEAAVSGHEGTGQNPKSTASGVGQFTAGTWNLFAQSNPALFQGMSADEILAKRGDPAFGNRAINWYAQYNAPYLNTAGVAPSGQSLGIAHYLGPQVAIATMQADPNTPMSDIIRKTLGNDTANKYLAANDELNRMTAGDMRKRYAGTPDPAFVTQNKPAPPTAAATPPASQAPLTASGGQLASTAPSPGYQVATADGYVPPPPAGTAELPSTPQGELDRQAIEKGRAAARGGGGGGTQVAQATPPPPAPNMLMTPQQAMQQYQQLMNTATMGDLLKLPIFGDPAMLRQTAQTFLKYALAPSQAAAEELSRAQVDLTYKPVIAMREAYARLGPELMKDGIKLNPDGTMGFIPGNPKTDPTIVGELESAKAQAEAKAQLLKEVALEQQKIHVDRNGNVYRGAERVAGWSTDAKTGRMTFTYFGGAGGGDGGGGGGGGGAGMPSAAPAGFGVPGVVPAAGESGGGGQPPPQIQLGPGEKETLTQVAAEQAKGPYKRQEADQKEVEGELANVITQNVPAMSALRRMGELADQVGSGAAAELRTDLGNFVDTFMPMFKGQFGKTDARQEFVKLATLLSGQQERGDQGSRGGARLLEMYLKANPSLQNQPDANKRMVNALLVYRQLHSDYADGATNFYNTQFDRLYGPEQKYTPVTRYDSAFGQTMRPELYHAAIQAMNGDNYQDWSRGLDSAQQKHVAGIIYRANPNAKFHYADGNTWGIWQVPRTNMLGPRDVKVEGG
jgi:hypothetical protein